MIKQIRAEETRPLRALILRPGQKPESLIYPRDDHPLACHLGAYDGDLLVGIASIYPEESVHHPNQLSWRLRGMAVREEGRRNGYGAALIDGCIQHIKKHQGEIFWCNARLVAVRFYETVGFQTEGALFDIPEIGPHYVMWRTV